MAIFPDAVIAVLERRLPEWAALHRIVGLNLLLLADGEVAWRRAYGVRRADEPLPIAPDTLFQAASLSKPPFAYVVLRLAHDGLLDLDAPLARYWRDPGLPDDPRLARVTAREVLRHATGWPNWRPEGEALHFHGAPGERFGYSGEGYVYLQRVLEALTGRSLPDLMRVELLDPLGMTDSHYVWRAAYENRAAIGHNAAGAPQPGRIRQPNTAYSLYTTADEYARFLLQVLAFQPGPLPLPDRARALHTTAQIPVADRVGWSLGWGVQAPDRARGLGPILWQWGDNNTFKSLAMLDLDRGDGLLAFANSAGADGLWRPLARLYFGADSPALRWLFEVHQRP